MRRPTLLAYVVGHPLALAASLGLAINSYLEYQDGRDDKYIWIFIGGLLFF